MAGGLYFDGFDVDGPGVNSSGFFIGLFSGVLRPDRPPVVY